MRFLVFDRVRTNPYLVPALVAISTVATLIVNALGMTVGITNVLPHLFYIPIVLAAYYYPRRGVLFSLCLAAVYCLLSLLLVNNTPDQLTGIVARAAVFVFIAAVVSYLSGRLREDTLLCQRLVSVVTSSNDGIIGETLDGIVTDWNRGAEVLYGYSAEEMTGAPITRLIPPELHEDSTRLLQRIRNGDVVEPHETRRITKDGRELQVSLSLSPIRDTTGTVIGASVIAHDITGQKQLRDEVQKAKDEWELTFNAVPDLIAIIDNSFHVVRVNPAMADRLGVKAEAAVGLTCFEAVHHTRVPPSFCPHQLLLQDGKGHSVDIHEENLHGDFSLTVTPLRSASGTLMGSVHILHDITDRKRAEEDLQVQNLVLAAQQEASPDGILILDHDGKVLSSNRQFSQMWNLPVDILMVQSEKLIQKFILGMLDEPGEFTAAVEYLKDHPQEKVHDEVGLLDGRVFDRYTAPILGPDDRNYGRIWYFRDITERRRSEQLVRESEEKFREIFDAVNDGIHLHEVNADGKPGRFVDVNATACGMLGYTRDELLAKSPLDLVTDYHSRPLPEIFRELGSEGSAIFETEHRRKDGSIVPVEVHAHAVRIQDKKLTLSIVRDITRRKQDEKALRDMSTDLRTIIDNATAMIWYKDTKNNFIRVNPAAARSFGMTMNDIEGKSGYTLFPAMGEKYYQDDLEVIRSGTPKIGIIEQMPTSHGRILWVQTDKVPLKNEQGQVTGILVIATDITDRKMAEDALATASKKLNLMASITRHDMLNQITALRTYIELSRDLAKDKVMTDFIDIEEGITETIELQIGFTRDYQNMGVRSPVWQRVNPPMEKAAASLPMRNIRLEIDPRDPEIYADPLFEKVFYNMIDNALRYGGDRMTMIRLFSYETANGLALVIEDDGVGIPASDKDHVFDKGFGHHTGLGTFLSREILAITGITIVENGEPGKGARFEMTVPKGSYRFTSTEER